MDTLNHMLDTPGGRVRIVSLLLSEVESPAGGSSGAGAGGIVTHCVVI